MRGYLLTPGPLHPACARRVTPHPSRRLVKTPVSGVCLSPLGRGLGITSAEGKALRSSVTYNPCFAVNFLVALVFFLLFHQAKFSIHLADGQVWVVGPEQSAVFVPS